MGVVRCLEVFISYVFCVRVSVWAMSVVRVFVTWKTKQGASEDGSKDLVAFWAGRAARLDCYISRSGKFRVSPAQGLNSNELRGNQGGP